MRVLRWGQSAYETTDDLARERDDARRLGFDWSLAPDARQAPDLTGVDVLVVTSQARVTASVAASFTGRAVITTTSGYDHLDVAALRARGVQVGRAPLARRDAVVEHALSELVGLLRALHPLHEAARRGQWARADLPQLAPRGLSGATVVVVGLGVIGSRMAELLTAFGATVRGVDPFVAADAWQLDAALCGADAVTVHCALSSTSRGLLSRARLMRLPAHAVVVNTARGDVLDVDAAVAMVREGALRGLSVDVFSQEPWPALASGAAVAGVRFTPHSAGYVHDLGARVAGELRAALRCLLAGAPLPHEVR